MEKTPQEIIRQNNLFAGLTSEQINKLLPLFRRQSFKTDELIICEGDPAADIFIIVEGEVEVVKKDTSANHQHRISLLTPGAVIGELALLDNIPRSASVRALQPTKALSIAINDLQALTKGSAEELKIYDKVITNLAREVTQRLRNTNEAVVKSLTNELRLQKTRALIGRLIINLIITISFYTFALNVISRITHTVSSTTIIGAPIVSILVCVTYFFIKKNKFPLSFYGLTLIGWHKSLLESLLFSLPVLALIVLAKYIAIKSFPSFGQLPLFEFSPTIHHKYIGIANHWLLIILPLIYLVFVPAQELVFRGVLQGSLEDFLTGPFKTGLAILVANFIFSMTHLHVGLGLAILVFLPGLFWGWLYSRHHTLLGVTVSHILIGGFAFFVVGINAFLNI